MAKISLFVIAALCLSAAYCDLIIKTEMTADDLHGHHNLNDMLVNTLNHKEIYMLGLSDYHAQWTYRGFEATQKQFHKAHGFIKTEVGHEFDLVKAELETATLLKTNNTWLTFVSLPAAKEGKTYPRVAMLKWDRDRRRFDVLMLASHTPLASSLQTPHLVRFSSHFGFEASEATLVAEAPSADAQHAYALARLVLVSAFEKVSFLRGVDKSSKWSEEQFKLWKSPMHQLGIDPVTAVFVAAVAVQIAAKIWGMLAKIFATVTKVELIGEFKSKGFSQYRLAARFRRNFDIKENDIEEYSTLLTYALTKNHPDARKKQKVAATIAMCAFMDKNSMMLDDGMIDAANLNQDRFFTLMSHRNPSGDKFTFISMNMEATFKLAPNLLVYKKSKKVFGGISYKEESIIEEKPREVTEEDVQAIRSFNLALAMKLFTDNLNVPGHSIPNYPPL